jgi:glycosyltransferase involved in cell wall biosynthesis
MRILIPVLGFGRTGGYRVLSELAKRWTAMGHQAAFLVNYRSPEPYFPTDGDIIWIDDCGARVSHSITGELPRRTGVSQVGHTLLSLLRGINRYGASFDVILANHNLTAWPVTLSRAHAKKYYYVQAYEPEYYAYRNGFNALLLRLTAAGSYLLPLKRIINSPVYYSYGWLRAKRYVPPGVDFTIFYPNLPQGSDHNNTVILGCIGRREPEKGVQYVLKALEILLGWNCDVELHVAYGNLPGNYFIHPKIKIIIPRNDQELAQYYRSLDILIAPGLVQLGAPHYPVMEAMACGIPTITTGYMPASKENAWLVPLRSAEGIADAVSYIIANPDKRYRKVSQGLDDIKQFSWNKAAEAMIERFDE